MSRLIASGLRFASQNVVLEDLSVYASSRQIFYAVAPWEISHNKKAAHSVQTYSLIRDHCQPFQFITGITIFFGTEDTVEDLEDIIKPFAKYLKRFHLVLMERTMTTSICDLILSMRHLEDLKFVDKNVQRDRASTLQFYQSFHYLLQCGDRNGSKFLSVVVESLNRHSRGILLRAQRDTSTIELHEQLIKCQMKNP